jgi:hypothetical protein
MFVAILDINLPPMGGFEVTLMVKLHFSMGLPPVGGFEESIFKIL